MSETTKWQQRQIPSKHDGKRCRTPVYHYGPDEVHVASWDYGVIRAGVTSKKSDEIVGYAVEYDFVSLETRDYPYSYASAHDIQILE